MQPASDPVATARERVLLGCFEVAGRTLAIDVAQLREVVRYREPVPLPGAPDGVEGVIDLRGALVPVVDLGRALGGAPTRPGRRTRIAVAEVEGLVVGLVVDAALEIVGVPGDALGDAPPLAREAGCELTRAVVRRAAGPMLPVLGLEAVLETLSRAALPRAGGEDAP